MIIICVALMIKHTPFKKSRDIKPKNLILSEAMDGYRVADFGVALITST